MRTAKKLIRLGGCPGESESSLGAHIIQFVLSCACSVVRRNNVIHASHCGFDAIVFL